MLATVTIAILLVWVLILSADNLLNYAKLRNMTAAHTALLTQVQDLATEVSQVYLTAADRELLGISPPKVRAEPSAGCGPQPKAKLKPAHSGPHTFTAPDLETPRRAMNREPHRVDMDGKAYVRICTLCSVRQAKVFYANKWTWVED